MEVARGVAGRQVSQPEKQRDDLVQIAVANDGFPGEGTGLLIELRGGQLSIGNQIPVAAIAFRKRSKSSTILRYRGGWRVVFWNSAFLIGK